MMEKMLQFKLFPKLLVKFVYVVIGTLGVSLSACSIPGKEPMFMLGPDEMELGLGIHGEPGSERTKLLNAKAVIDILFKRLEKSEKNCLVKGQHNV